MVIGYNTKIIIRNVEDPFSDKWFFDMTQFGTSHYGTSTCPVSADIDGDGIHEIFVGGGLPSDEGNDGVVVCLDGITGNLNWYYESTGFGRHTVLELGDVDQDGKFELVACGYKNVVVFNAEDSSVLWEFTEPDSPNIRRDKHPIILKDTDGETYVYLAANSPGKLQKRNGATGEIVAENNTASHPCHGGLSCADLDGDGDFEITNTDRAYSSGSGLQCFDSDLNLLWNYNEVACSSHCATLVDVNDDDILDVVILNQGSYGGICVVDGSNGQKMSGKWDKTLGLGAHDNPNIYDIDNDGNLELITTYNYDSTPAYVWDLGDWSLDATLWADTGLGFEHPPTFGNVMDDEKFEIIGFSDDLITVYDENYDIIGQKEHRYANVMMIQDIDNDSLNELVTVGAKSIGGQPKWGVVQVYDTLGDSPTIRTRSGNSWYSERRLGAPVFVESLAPLEGGSPPQKPVMTGPTSGFICIPYFYFTYTSDPDGDYVKYGWDWNDGSTIEWSNWYLSGDNCTMSHIWDSPGTYNVKVKAKDSRGNESNWSDLLSVAVVNHPPDSPDDPDPYDGETDVDINIDISWTGSDLDSCDTITYDVYFGTTTPISKVANNQTNTLYCPGELNFNTTYFWRIIAWDNHGNSTPGQLWSFTTRNNNQPNIPSDPDPDNGATDVDINADISWTGGDPDGDSVTYDVYFEAYDPTPDELVSDNQSESWFNPGTMEYVTHYYWQIVAWDEYGESTTGLVWDFTTGTQPNEPPNKPSNPSPEDDSTSIDIDICIGWTGGDPDGDDVIYDVYLEANDPSPDDKVADDISETIFCPGTLDYITTYYWRINALDEYGASTWGPVWCFTTKTPEPDLLCDGSLSWIDVKPGEKVAGNFTVVNVGDKCSELDWEIIDWPKNCGTWEFTPFKGEKLRFEDGPVVVNVTVIVPSEKNSKFTGTVKIVNKKNTSDNCTIPFCLKTLKNNAFNFNLNLLYWLFVRFPNIYQMLNYLFGLLG